MVVLTFYQPRIIFYFVQLAISKICTVCVSSNTCNFRRLCFFCFVYGMGHMGVLWHSRFKTIQAPKTAKILHLDLAKIGPIKQKAIKYYNKAPHFAGLLHPPPPTEYSPDPRRICQFEHWGVTYA